MSFEQPNYTTQTASAYKANIDASFAETGKVVLPFSAITASLPALSYVDGCFHLAKDDPDRGAWRRRKGQSWRSEARSSGRYLGSYATAAAAVTAGGIVGDVFYNTGAAVFHEITAIGTPASTATIRAGREDYPGSAFVTVEAARPVVWDADTSTPSMWAVGPAGLGTISSVAAGGSRIVIGSSTGIWEYDFVRGAWANYSASGRTQRAASSFTVLGAALFTESGKAIVNSTVNDVAIIFRSGAPLNEFGMRIPTIAAETEDGVSVINHNGVVADLANTAGDSTTQVAFDRHGNLYYANATSGELDMFKADNYDADDLTPNASYSASSLYPRLLEAFTATRRGLVHTGTEIIIGHSTGLTRLLPNMTQPVAGMAVLVTSTYNTGWLLANIRRCFLANSKTADRSYKGGLLVEVGTITETVNAGGRNVYSGFSASNYLQEASHADWNSLSTDFSILMSGVKWGTAGVTRWLFSVGDGVSVGSFAFALTTAGNLLLQIHNGTSMTSIAQSSIAFTDAQEHVVELSRGTVGGVANTIQIKVDGVVVASAVSALTLANSTGYLRIGVGQHNSNPFAGGQLACFRISSVAPYEEHSKFIAATENALNGGAACLLSNSSTVSAISYDKATDTLRVGNGTNVDTFSGLKRIASAAHGVTTLTALAAANGCSLTVGTGAAYAAPERGISVEMRDATAPLTQQYSFTTPAATTTQVLPKGWMAQGIAFNTTDSTFLGTYTQSFDGLVWTVAGLTASKAYQLNLVEDK